MGHEAVLAEGKERERCSSGWLVHKIYIFHLLVMIELILEDKTGES